MEFIKKMKTREFIEMSLKTVTALLLAFIAIILMEGMIYSITLHGTIKNSTGESYSTDAKAYCIESGENKEGETVYVILSRLETGTKGEYEWQASNVKYTKESINNVIKPKVGEIVYGAPNAFEFSIEPFHYAIMVVFVAGVSGFFVYKFIKLVKTYKEIEENFKKDGTIEISNI